MSNVLRQRANTGRAKALAEGWSPAALRFAPGQQTVVQFSNGEEAGASCLRCTDAPCAKFSDEETIPSNFDRFPADRNPDVCAAGAINQPDGGGAPTIDAARCILCGVCSSRCPVGAIRLIPGQGAIVDDVPNVAFIEVADILREQHLTDRQAFEGLPAEGAQLIENDALVDEVFGRMQRAWVRVGDRFPNLLARNLLLGAGIGASVGRKGNNHMRMDLILSSPAVEHGVAEVEFGQEAVLDAPRDTMDALAVLASRYGWDLNSITAVVVTDVLPNRRSEYWHIIQDISNVFGVQIGTVTVFLLMLFNWNRRTLELGEGQPFYADRETESYRAEVLELLIGRAVYLSNSPRPQIDIAK
ncbi:4Fe-4S binding protein [Comamonas aquatica]|uniref:4Fe-4S binding protein n=1 Tax=Comamonas aquatica TaxID=225991 RepID=UPI00244C2E4D|nr:4Fe-4S binding protein [Comamonas aquatica]MDH0899010.1 4Fe-4S binding protein [Comamonas aquatica]